MRSAGFEYTGMGDVAKCNACGLEVSTWTREKDPFQVHAECKPNCTFVESVLAKTAAKLNDAKHLGKYHELSDTTEKSDEQIIPFELESLKQARQRTFSHYPSSAISLKDQLIRSGFFGCNVHDRVICIYCNLICQQWDKDIDDPAKVHSSLSSQCPYVLNVLNKEAAASTCILNGTLTNNDVDNQTVSDTVGRLSSDPVVYTSPRHAEYMSLVDRKASFQTWPAKSMPSVEDLVKAGFFYTGQQNIVKCFHCDGSLEKWGANDNPLIEHVRRFPCCLYAKQLAGDQLYNRIRQAQNDLTAQTHMQISSTTGRTQLEIPNEALLSRLVAARLDLPITQRLISQNFKLSIIKRCWEDQLRLKRDDFVSDCDLYIACLVLQKQVEHIAGNKNKVVIPSVKMKEDQEKKQPGVFSAAQTTPLMSIQCPSNINNSSIRQGAPPNPPNATNSHELSTSGAAASETERVVLNNPCLLCAEAEKRVACVPCGHLAVCVNCSRTLRACPTCRRSIEAFVRIYI
ncbi:unnamed protein product [Adineta ricciae]|uniref:RING-type domain-containing protein n=1 Tax=Adineta ricciae TaxID=249248 RepID=A0A813PR57_ADIRI|nr:unnamed protein product [Adineta ricciae]CAF1352735.1 unnamed protein product [Adineta ricciae]